MKNVKKEIENVSLWLKEYMEINGFKGFVLGLSGGIDSAVSLGLAVKAVGKENVKCFALPCTALDEKERIEDLDDAKLVANTFGVVLNVVNLNNTVLSLYNENIYKYNREDKKLVLANIKARLRMTTLRSLAECYGYLVLGTTNKTEEYLGYFTKAGDGGAGVDIEPISDYFKYEIKELARGLGVPERIITKSPSAGLWDDQTDEGEIGFLYDDIDKYLSVREELTQNNEDKYNPWRLFIESDSILAFNGSKVPMVDVMKTMKKVQSLRLPDALIERVEGMITSASHKRYFPPFFKR